MPLRLYLLCSHKMSLPLWEQFFFQWDLSSWYCLGLNWPQGILPYCPWDGRPAKFPSSECSVIWAGSIWGTWPKFVYGFLFYLAVTNCGTGGRALSVN